MKRIIFTILLILYCGGISFAATYYISPSGSDTTGTGTSANPWATLNKGFNIMSSGDVLICKDGTYTGALNQITADNHPPVGSVGAWTTVRAENDGAAIFDGVNARNMLDVYESSLTSVYWVFEGLLWCKSSGSTAGISNCRYVKFLRCGAFDAGSGNNVNFDNSHSDYILYENCYAYGSGRYKFLAYQSDHVVYRQCVGRFDRVSAGGEPIAVFSLYSVDYGEVQNCIAIDSDQTSAWSSVGMYGGGFLVPSTDMNANNINFRSCITLKSRLGGFMTTGNEYFRAADVLFDNCVEWDTKVLNNESPNVMRGLRVTLRNCTFGIASGLTEEYLWSYDSGGNGSTTSKNNVFYQITGAAVNYDVETQDYNSYYANSSNNNSGAHDISNVNPIWNVSTNTSGGLKYLVRIEDGSSLDGRGENGADIGANLNKLIGVSGTIWGETGYAAEQAADMWPFPYEDLIRTKMKAYSDGGVSGNRGFCADGTTLTQYIWEYLGNTVDEEFYDEITDNDAGEEDFVETYDSDLSNDNFLIDNQLGGAGGGGGGCFIATAVFADAKAPEVVFLQKFKQEILFPNSLGRSCVILYYRISPSIADYIKEHEWLRSSLRVLLKELVELLKDIVRFKRV